MKMMREFKEFATKGNVIDLAVAVVIGGAFGKIVTSFVDSIVMPLLGILLGGKDFSQLVWQVGEVQVTYGIFIQNIINFIIIALAIFIVVVKFMGSMKNKEVVVEKKGPSQEELLTEIRDLLKVK